MLFIGTEKFLKKYFTKIHTLWMLVDIMNIQALNQTETFSN